MKILIVLGLLLVSHSAHALKAIHWDRTVTQIELIVGVDQPVLFEAEPTVGLSGMLKDPEIFRNNYGSTEVYWRAIQPFTRERIEVRVGGDVMQFDVTATKADSGVLKVEPIQIVSGHSDRLAADDPVKTKTPNAGSVPLTVIDLVRLAAQHDWLPARLHDLLPGSNNVKTTKKELSSLYKDNQASKRFDIRVAHAWQAGGMYVTAIKVKNKTRWVDVVDPSKFEHSVRATNGVERGFIANGMLVTNLAPKGHRYDHTFMYLVTQDPFHKTIQLRGEK